MDVVWYYLLHIVAPIAGWETGKWIVRRIRLKKIYKFDCPECQFKLRTDSRESYEISKSSHNHVSSRERYNA